MKKKVFILSISLLFGIAFSKECKYHKVKSGESIEKIAKNYGVSVQELLKANKNIKPNKLKVGESLCIPQRISAKAQDYAIYKVKKGDTLQSIAEKFGVDVQELKSFNNLKSEKVKEGQEIKIPAKGTAKKQKKETQEYGTYVVQKSAKLEHVAKKLGVSQRELEELNPELKGKWLKKGTVVKVPKQEQKKEKREESYTVYKIKKGGRLEHVAKNLGVPKEELERLNPELKGKWLSAGTEVKVPIKAKKEEEPRVPYKTYVVQRGAKLEHVAKKLGVSQRELEELNPELKGKWLKRGTVVKVPVKVEEKRHAVRPVENPLEERKQESTSKAEAEMPQEKKREDAEVKISKNSLPMPVDGKVSKNGRGITIATDCGKPVRAVDSGRVIYSGGDLKAYGNMVIVDHGDFISIYAYNEKNLVKRGDSVSRGQQIALVGRKNEGEECMLYFELRSKEGVPLDPTEYIRNTQ
ncbi:LysM peptidoglycan-binding domain-containing protein [Thermocrinis sp.]|jgi:murein DD-endopeptidase MepM/ murein hydrolase activator NlpD|uniref:LysM peptidoglycan-binding domain-containing protein n=1 Tax=Thermocrinis sp. TaxID=2024383 RepID=UPI00262EAF2B|nr:LysM peptidoglycan-binding domain-containing protein [Thermocrinis sp.]